MARRKGLCRRSSCHPGRLRRISYYQARQYRGLKHEETKPHKHIERAIDAILRGNYVSKLYLYGSVLRDDFKEDSDIDMLVEFEPGT